MNPLDQLADVSYGDAISWWPLTFAWWLSIAFALLLLAASVYSIRLYRQKRRAKRLALQALARINTSAPNALVEFNTVLRQVSLAYFQADEVASLHGKAWVQFLLSHYTKSDKHALQEVLMKVQDSLYQPQCHIDITQAEQAIKRWVKHALPPQKHRTSGGQDV